MLPEAARIRAASSRKRPKRAGTPWRIRGRKFSSEGAKCTKRRGKSPTKRPTLSIARGVWFGDSFSALMLRAAVGDFEVTLIRAGVYHWDGGAFFGVVPKTLWNRRIPADELNRIPVAFNLYLIRTPEHSILVDTGE